MNFGKFGGGFGGFGDLGKNVLGGLINQDEKPPPTPPPPEEEIEEAEDVDEPVNLPPIDFSNDLMGGIMSAVWPHASKYVQSEILGSVQRSISGSFNFSNLLNVFKFTTSSMGTVVPRMTNFRLVDTSDKSVVIVVDVEYNGDAHFEAEIGTSFANIPIGLQNVSFNGPLQIELKDLTSKVPFVSAMVMYFIDPPTVDFKMTKSAEFANHPLVSKNMKQIVKDSMATQLLEPQRMVVPLAISDASVYRFPMPKQLLKLTVVEAADLTNTDSGVTQGCSDPFAMIYLDPANQSRTEIVRNNLNPVWNHSSLFTLFRKNAVVQINVMDTDDIEDVASISGLTDNIPTDDIPFGLGDKLKDAIGSGSLGGFGDKLGGMGGFLGSLGGFGEKLGGLHDKMQDAAKNIPIPGLEDKLKEYTEDKLGSCKIRLKKLKDKTNDKWFKLKGTESGKIHVNATFFNRTTEPILEEPKFTVFQFYLKEIEGLRVDHPEYENKTQVYRAEIVLSSGEKLDLGLAKIDPDEHYNFAVFDQAVYAILHSPQEEISGVLKIWLVGNETTGNEHMVLGTQEFNLSDGEQEITHRTKFGENSSIRGRIKLETYQ